MSSRHSLIYQDTELCSLQVADGKGRFSLGTGKQQRLCMEQWAVGIRKGENFSWGFCDCSSPFSWESVGDKRRNQRAGSSQSVLSRHLKSETSRIVCKGVGWSGRYTNYSDRLKAYNWGAGDSQESQGGFENNHSHHLGVLLIKTR